MRTLKVVALAALMGASFSGHALELYCAGESVIGGSVGTNSIVFEMSDTTLRAKIWTPEGDAIGILSAGAKNYTGLVEVPETGSRYSLSLNRYTGSLFLMRVDPPAPDSKAAFWGTCLKAERRF
ncbi:hypothetical protein [Stenotrophomonas sp. AB1(2024)]|uniref:hypothetical protein n=1 Tax=Stenotrophomonas sp. AB1(2024) TaxID=3132215 RepID=UPI0030A3C0DD